MKSTNQERPPQKSEEAREHPAKPSTAVKKHSDSGIAMTAQTRSTDIDAGCQTPATEDFNECDFDDAIPHTLPEMEVIFENEYTM